MSNDHEQRRSSDLLLQSLVESGAFTQSTLIAIQKELATLSASHTALTHELIGNGQAGRIQRIEDELALHRKKFIEVWKAHTGLRNRVVYYLGAATGAIFVYLKLWGHKSP